ncbi:MAG: M3 family oligoendopeptidase, partial [Planctomycetia bacterium]|nr:M3 family oligoendopeptidase [Planctomycetia bacterium]
YVEYAIAQLGALQVWRNHRNDPDEAIRLYRNGLSKGNTVTLPQLYKETGTRFDFSYDNLSELIEMVREEIETLESAIV